MRYDWNSEKNDWLKINRKISFEKIIYHLSKGDVWRIASNPNQEKYPMQKVYFVIVNDYIYMVPFVKDRDKIFLKTIIPNRKATKEYLKKENKNETK